MHRLPVRVEPTHDASIIHRLLTLAKLELELGLAETRDVAVSAATAVAVAVPALVLLLAALVVLAAAAFAWSAWRLTHLSWPRETVASFQESWRWLGTQLRSTLRLR